MVPIAKPKVSSCSSGVESELLLPDLPLSKGSSGLRMIRASYIVGIRVHACLTGRLVDEGLVGMVLEMKVCQSVHAMETILPPIRLHPRPMACRAM